MELAADGPRMGVRAAPSAGERWREPAAESASREQSSPADGFLLPPGTSRNSPSGSDSPTPPPNMFWKKLCLRAPSCLFGFGVASSGVPFGVVH